jgi:predicted regulator of Ras-like GTPase activity (Roadblock/LC7/MglB family)
VPRSAKNLRTSWRRRIVTAESSLIASTAMEAARALADLVEISPQIEAAVVVTADGEPAGSVGVPEPRVGVLARSLRELLDGAASFRSDRGRITQLHAELRDGDVFAVTAEDERTIVAVTSGRTSPGLVFYDLKRCLAAVADET